MKNWKMLKDFFLSYFIEDYPYDYWHFPHVVSDFISQGDYFINFLPKADYKGPFDSDNIPLLDLSTQHSERRNWIVYNPIVICQYGLAWFAKYIRYNEKFHLDHFFNIADWIVKHSVNLSMNGKQVAVLYFDYYEDGKVLSAMAQGLAVSLLCRAYAISGNPLYLTKAVELHNIFNHLISEGGVVDTSLGFPVLEEYTHEPIHILNGHLFAFAGIIDLKNAKDLMEKDKEAIFDDYNKYLHSSLCLIKLADMKFWTKYSLRSGILPNISSLFYHNLHIEMMKGLNILTGVDDFNHYQLRWFNQKKNTIFKMIAMALKLADRMRYKQD